MNRVTVVCSECVLCTLDVMISAVVIAPCVVGFWRGTWEYMNYFPTRFPLWWTLFVSSALHLAFTLLRDGLIECFQTGGGVAYAVVSRCYIYVFAVCCAMQWRSTWQILEESVGYDLNALMLFTVPSTIILFVFKLFGNTLAPPYAIAVDFKPQDVFQFPTMFNIPVSRSSLI